MTGGSIHNYTSVCISSGANWGVFALEVVLKPVLRCKLRCFCTWGGAQTGSQVRIGAFLHLWWCSNRFSGANWGVFAPEVVLKRGPRCKLGRFCTWGGAQTGSQVRIGAFLHLGGGAQTGSQVQIGVFLHLGWCTNRFSGANWGVFAPEVVLKPALRCKLGRFCT